MKSPLAFVGLVVIAAVSAGGALAQSPMTLRFADSLPENHLFTQQLAKPWMAEVSAASKGTIQFQHYPAEQLGKAKDMLALAQTGVADIAFVTPIYISDKLPLSGVVDLPGGFTTACEGLKAFWPLATGKGLLATKEFAPNGIRVLMAVVQPPFQIFTAGKKIESTADLQGLKLRTAGGAQDLTASKLKIVSVKLTAPETNEAMTRGTIDGGILAPVSIGAYGLTDLIKYATTGENFGSAVLTWAISEQKFKTLSPEVQKVMMEAGERISVAACKKIDEGVDKQIAAWQAKGVTIVRFSKDDHAKLSEVFDEVGKEWANGLERRGKPGHELLSSFRAALDAK